MTGQTGGGHRLDRSCAAEAVAASRRLCSHASPRRSFSSPLKPSRSTREQNSIWPLHPRSSEPSTLLARPERTPPLPWPPPRQTPLLRASSTRDNHAASFLPPPGSSPSHFPPPRAAGVLPPPHSMAGRRSCSVEVHPRQGRRQGGGQGPGLPYDPQIYTTNLNFD